MTKPINLTIDYEIIVHNEDFPPEGNAIDSGDLEFDNKYISELNDRLGRGDIWAWCCVEVKCILNDEEGEPLVSGSAYLGGCSYDNETDFRNCVYYSDMQEEARSDMLNHAREMMNRMGPIGAYLETVIDNNRGAKQ
jgi:hypothetical protein